MPYHIRYTRTVCGIQRHLDYHRFGCPCIMDTHAVEIHHPNPYMRALLQYMQYVATSSKSAFCRKAYTSAMHSCTFKLERCHQAGQQTCSHKMSPLMICILTDAWCSEPHPTARKTHIRIFDTSGSTTTACAYTCSVAGIQQHVLVLQFSSKSAVVYTQHYAPQTNQPIMFSSRSTYMEYTYSAWVRPNPLQAGYPGLFYRAGRCMKSVALGAQR